MANKILTTPEIQSLISITNKYCYWLFFRFLIIYIGTIIKTLEIFKELVFDLVFETVDDDASLVSLR